MALFLSIFAGLFVALIVGVVIYRRIFDRARWDAAADRARSAWGKSRVESKLALQEHRDRTIKAAAERKADFERRQNARREAFETERQARFAVSAAVDPQLRPILSGAALKKPYPAARGKSKRRYREDPVTGALIAGLAAASLEDDFRNAVDLGDSEADELRSSEDGWGSDGDWD